MTKLITIASKRTGKKIEKSLEVMKTIDIRNLLKKYGELGVEALAANTPVDTGKTASSWNYNIEVNGKTIRLTWTNSNVNRGVNIALILQYGHATRNKGWVEGRDYINPAIQPIFEQMAEEAWQEVKNA